LQDLPRRVGARVSRRLSDAATGGAATRISKEPIVGIYRTQANEPRDVQRGACSEPTDADGFVYVFPGAQSKTVGGGSKEFVSAGKQIYEEGVPKAEVPPCASCHGPDAKGADAFPRLAGQLHDYIFRKLTNWDKERGQDKANPDNSAIMQPIAHNLTEAQIKAVAAYLSYLE
jgi:cytochrome c553